jgi:hypothetical protein
MKYKTVNVCEGERLGDVPVEFDYEPFCKRFMGGRHQEMLAESITTYRDMLAAYNENREGIIASEGDFEHEVIDMGLYDGWPFWAPRPCYFWKTWAGGEWRNFYELRAFRRKASVDK